MVAFVKEQGLQLSPFGRQVGGSCCEVAVALVKANRLHERRKIPHHNGIEKHLKTFMFFLTDFCCACVVVNAIVQASSSTDQTSCT